MIKNMRKQKMNSNAIASGIGIGAGVALIISIILSALLTSLVINAKIKEEQTTYIFVTRVLSVTVGCLIGSKISAGKKLMTMGSITCAYLTIIIALGIIVYGSSLNNIASGATSIILGAVIAYLITMKRPGKSKHRTKYTH